jgi:hypothetical protein
MQLGTTVCSGITGITDNLGNAYVVNKLMTTKFPLNGVLMQLATTLARKGLWLDLRWAPREDNVFADQLTNEDFQNFDPSKRLDIEWDDIPTDMLDKLVKAMEGFHEEVEKQRARKRQAGKATGNTKKRRRKEVWG